MTLGTEVLHSVVEEEQISWKSAKLKSAKWKSYISLGYK